MNLTGQPIYERPEPAESDPAYLRKVRALPCIICWEYGLPQNSPSTAHHWIMGRGGNRKTPDREAIPLCDGHHQGTFDTSKVALHRNPAEWERLYGRDKEYSARVRAIIKGKAEI